MAKALRIVVRAFFLLAVAGVALAAEPDAVMTPIFPTATFPESLPPPGAVEPLSRETIIGPHSQWSQPADGVTLTSDPSGVVSASSAAEQMARELRHLEARLSALEKQQGASGVSGSKDVSGEKFSVRPVALLHADYVNVAGQNAESLSAYGDVNDYFEFRRIYLGVEGAGYGVWEYRIILNFEPEQILRDSQGTRLAETDAVQIRDLTVSHKDVPLLGVVTVGNCKVPFSLEELIPARFHHFMERAAPCDAFVPKRRVGLMCTNSSPSELFGWSTGVFFANISQETKERVNDEQGVIWAARSWWSPVYLPGGRVALHLGGGYVFTSDDDGIVRFHARPEAQEAPYFIDTRNFPADYIHRGSLEAALVAGPFSVQGELFEVHTISEDWPDNQFHGAFVMMSYFLTGEHRPYDRRRGNFGRIVPHTNFWWVKTPDGPSWGWGAWEIAGRWSWTDLDEPGVASPLAGQMHNMTLAINWYWNPQMRMMFEWIHSFSKVRSQPEVAQTDIVGLSWRADF